MQSRNIFSSKRWKKIIDNASITHFTSSHGSKDQIYVKRIAAATPSENELTLFLFHDITSYHGRFNNLISWLRVQCPHVNFVMMDFIGHGLSSGTRGHIPDFKILSADIESLFLLMNDDFPKKTGEKWIALGHGVGALALLDLISRTQGLIEENIDRLILSNFILNFSSSLLHIEKKLSGISFLKQTLGHMRPVEIYKAEEILSHSEGQTTYLQDPLINRRPTFQSLKGVTFKVNNIYQDSYFLDKPTLLLKSESIYHHGRGAESFSKGFKKELLTEKNYFNLKHDLYNEKDNLNVFQDISEWMGK